MKLLSVINVLLVLAMAQMLPGFSDSSYSTQDVVEQSVLQIQKLPVAGARGPEKVKVNSIGILTDAPSVVIRDVESGVVLMSRGDKIVRPIASITKLMTAMVLLDDYDWSFTDTATVLRKDVREGGRWYYRFNDELVMDDLFTTMLVTSGNNETIALVREVGALETDFVDKMNIKAKELGMYNTSFADPVGLSPDTVSTADDVMIMLNEAIKREEISSRIHETKVVTSSLLGNKYKTETTNLLFKSFLNREPYKIVGGKTGSLDEAGYGLTVRIEHGKQLVDVVVLGASEPSARFSDVKALVSWVFDVYSWDKNKSDTASL